MIKNMTCVLCPNSCELTATLEGGEVVSVDGNRCPKGYDYAVQELLDPRRTIASSIFVKGGEQPLVSVRLTNPIPKKYIFQLMDEIRKMEVEAPVRSGQVLLSNVFETDANLIATRNVTEAK